MKKIKLTALVVVCILAIGLLAGCSAVKWDDIKNNDVVATVNGREVTKLNVAYQYEEDKVSKKVSQSMIQQMGIGDLDEQESSMDEALLETLQYYIAGDYARSLGYGLTEQEAYDKAYNEGILLAKKGGYEYITDYNDQIKKALYFDDEKFVKYSADKIYNRQAAMEYAEVLLKEMQFDYPEDDALVDAVSERLMSEAANVQVTLAKHDKSILKKLSFHDIVAQAEMSFLRDTEGN